MLLFTTIIDRLSADLIIIFLALFLLSSHSKPFLKLIKLSFAIPMLIGVCSICLNMFYNCWCSYGKGVNDEGIVTREAYWKFEFIN